jgi:tetratricopeptide (TPR) repeat protein
MPWDLFFSYRRHDLPRAQPLLDALKEAGIRVWRDQTDISDQASITDEIRKAIGDSKGFLAFYSGTYWQSAACRQEFTIACLAANEIGHKPSRRIWIYNPESSFEYQQREWAKAGELLQETLAAFKGSPQEEAPNLLLTRLTAMNNLAAMLKQMGDWTEARRLEEEILSRSSSLGERHPNTLPATVNLTTTLLKQGEVTGARKLQARALRICRHLRGEESRPALQSMLALAATFTDRGTPINPGRLVTARRLLEQTLKASRRIYGEEDRLALMAAVNYADVLQAVGDREEAIRLLEHVLSVSSRVLKEGDDVTMRAIDILKALRESS